MLSGLPIPMLQGMGKLMDTSGGMRRRIAPQPHQPRRGPNTVGLVIEVKRDDREMQDGLQWYCEKCNNLLHEYRFVLHNIEKDFLPRFREFYGSVDHRTCKKCVHVMETDPRFV